MPEEGLGLDNISVTQHVAHPDLADPVSLELKHKSTAEIERAPEMPRRSHDAVIVLPGASRP